MTRRCPCVKGPARRGCGRRRYPHHAWPGAPDLPTRRRDGSMPPNVVIVITHDTGRHLGTYGRRVATPSLDRLAAEGVVFEQAFCPAPQCSPSRASLLTGLMPHRHGLIGLAHRGFRPQRHALRRTLPRLLGSAGYRTHLFGFQHEAADPYALGYQRVVQPPPTGSRRHLCRDVAPAAAAFLAGGPTEPFFVMVG